MQVLAYDPETGVFSRLGAGKAKVGTRLPSGYTQIMIDGRQHYAHRLAWLYVKGEWPAAMTDHINGDKSDNRIANLRAATAAENQQNGSRISVRWNAQRQKWQAAIRVGGKRTYLGLHSAKDDAIAAYLQAKAQLHTFQPTPRLTR